MKQGAIFDMDGLMFDTERVYQRTWLELAKELGQTPNPDFPRRVAGTLGEGMYQVIRAFYPEVDPVQMWNDCKTRVAEQVAKELPEKPGLHEILSGLKEAGLCLAVASSSPMSTIQRNLNQAGIAHYFDAVVSSAQTGRGKPNPDVFLLAAKELGLPPEQCYVLEDSPNGVRAGVAAGCTTIMVPDTIPPDEEIRSMAAAVCDDLIQVLELIKADRI